MSPAELGPGDLDRLKAVFDGAMAGLEGVEAKRLFGCDGYFVQGNIFGLVWKEGRLGLRLTREASRGALMAEKGADPWVCGDRPMRFWVLLPVAMHARPRTLKDWAATAWQQALERPPRESVTRRKEAPRPVKPAVFRRLAP